MENNEQKENRKLWLGRGKKRIYQEKVFLFCLQSQSNVLYVYYIGEQDKSDLKILIMGTNSCMLQNEIYKI